MEKTMSNAGVSGYIDVSVRSPDGTERKWGFHNAIMDYGLEFLANASLRDGYGTFAEIILSDGEQPIKLTDLSPNYEEKYFRSNKINTTFSTNVTGGVLCNSDYPLNVKIINTAIFHLFDGNATPNSNNHMFDLREISLMVGHMTNVFDDSYSAVFAKSKMKDDEGHPFSLEIYSGDILTITYSISVNYNINLGTNQMVARGAYENYTHRYLESYENAEFICQRVKSVEPTESVFNFEVKKQETNVNFGASYPKAYINTGLVIFEILLASSSGREYNTFYSLISGSTYLYNWTGVGKYNLRIKYSRFNTVPDLTTAEVLSKSTITKVDNLSYKYTVPNGARILLMLNGEVNTMIPCDTAGTVEMYPQTTGLFDTNYSNSPFYDVYIQYKELPLIYHSTIKGIDKVAPYITQGKWESPTQYSFYTETPSSLTVTLQGGHFDDIDLTTAQVDLTNYTNADQLSIYGEDISKWQTIVLRTKSFQPTDTTEFLDANKSIGKYYLNLPIAIKDFNYFTIIISDAVGNTYASGNIFTARVDYQPEDLYMNYADYKGVNDYINGSTSDTLRINMHLNNVKIED